MLSADLQAIGEHLLDRLHNGEGFNGVDACNLVAQLLKGAGEARAMERRIEAIAMAAARPRPSLFVIQGDQA